MINKFEERSSSAFSFFFYFLFFLFRDYIFVYDFYPRVKISIFPCLRYESICSYYMVLSFCFILPKDSSFHYSSLLLLFIYFFRKLIFYFYFLEINWVQIAKKKK